MFQPSKVSSRPPRWEKDGVLNRRQPAVICQPHDDRWRAMLQGTRHCTISSMLPNGSTRALWSNATPLPRAQICATTSFASRGHRSMLRLRSKGALSMVVGPQIEHGMTLLRCGRKHAASPSKVKWQPCARRHFISPLFTLHLV